MAARNGRNRIHLVGLPSPYSPPMSRLPTLSPNVLMPQRETPYWKKPISLAPPAGCGSRSVSAHRAPIREPVAPERLSGPPPPQTLLDSDGVPTDLHGRKATLSFAVSCRTSVISADWVHTEHAETVRTWRVRFPATAYVSRDIFIGCTEATSFENAGRTVVFDCKGAMRAGHHPLNLFQRFSANDVRSMEGAEVVGEFNRPVFSGETKVTVDVTNPATATLRLQFSSGDTIVYPIDHFSHARLCVSMRGVGDVIELL